MLSKYEIYDPNTDIFSRTYEKFYGQIGERLAKLNRLWNDLFEESFVHYYETIHRFETNRLRIVAHFFAYLLASEAIGMHVLSVVKMTEEDTTSSSRIFVKILFEELLASLGQKVLVEKFKDPMLADSLTGLFPTDADDQNKTRFSINFFTAIGMGVLTEGMRDWLKNSAPKPKAIQEVESESDADSVSSYSSRTSSTYSRSRSRSRSPVRKRKDSRSSSRGRSYTRSASPPRKRVTRARSASYTSASRSRSRSRSPPRKKRVSRSRSRGRSYTRSASPPPKKRGPRSYTSSASPAPKKRGARSYSSASRSRSPVPTKGKGRRSYSSSRSRSPPVRRRGRSPSVSVSRSPPRKTRARSPE
jgi:pre-mRNA-splicing factor CWC22